MVHFDSYDVNSNYRDVNAELERLHAQALLSWQQEARLLTWLGLQNGMTILELGSGPGFITEQLLLQFPDSFITGVDINPAMHAKAEQYLCDRFSKRLKLVSSSVMNTGLPENAYDFAIARLVFQHLNHPVTAAKEALRVLKPGGKLVVIDIDASLWGIAEPYVPDLQAIYAKASCVQNSRGGNRLIGRKLWRILQASGYTNLRLEAFVYHSDEVGLEPFKLQLDPDRLLPAVHAGLISAQELATAHIAYQRFLSSPNAYILMLGLLACGEKPPKP